MILDTDPALGIMRDGKPRDVDDGLAIIEAINAPELDLLGITIVFGNAASEEGLRVARHLVGLKGAKVPVLPGAAAAAGELDNAVLTPAVTFMAEQLARQRLTIVAIGPLTNVAALLQHYPERAKNIDAVIAVMGRSPNQHFYIGDSGPVRDFNFAMDPVSAEAVMQSGIPIVLAPFELSVQAVVTPQHLETIKAHKTAAARYLFNKTRNWVRFWMKTFPGDGGFHPWDSAAIAVLLQPDLLKCEDRGFRIRMADDAAHGIGDAKTGRVMRKRPWLETDKSFGDGRLRYCYGFQPGARASFIANIVARVF
ncbi:MAG: nucleoside hydrolase [Methyloligellaceae bacterium]